jgi:hypothetical protein
MGPRRATSGVTFSSPEPRLIFLGCGGVMAGSLLWSEGWIPIFAAVLMGIGWALIAWGLVRLMRRGSA